MPDDNYFVVDQLATGTETVIRSTFGSYVFYYEASIGILGTYLAPSLIRLDWNVVADSYPQAAMGQYTSDDGVTHTLIVHSIPWTAHGGGGRDLIYGNSLNNYLWGDPSATSAGGNDTIYGGAGNDRISGDNGDDLLFGGSGNDRFTSDPGADTIDAGSDPGDWLSYRFSDAGIQFVMTAGNLIQGTGGHAEGDQIIGRITISASFFADTFTDTIKANLADGSNASTIYAERGHDRLTMGGGNDFAYGGDGRDSILGEYGDDVLSGGAHNDTVRGGYGNDRVKGETGNDSLFGDHGRDVIHGGGGDDSLRGGNGPDELTGATGADIFDFHLISDSTVRSAGRDRITYFNAGDGDRIRLADIDANTATPEDDAFTFIGTAAFTLGTPGQLRLTQISTDWIVLGDTDGDRFADFAFTVLGPTAPQAADFIL